MDGEAIQYRQLFHRKEDERLSWFLTGYFLMQAINLFVKIVIGNFRGWTLISRGILAILLLFALKPMLKEKVKDFAGIEILFLMLFGYTLLFKYASFSEYSSIIINVITVFIPMGVAVLSIRDKQVLLDKLYLASWPTQVILLYVLVTRRGFNYSMIGGYTLTFQALIVFDRFLEDHKWYNFLIFLLDFIVVFIFGSRGPLLCFCTMVILKLFASSNVSIFRKIVFAGMVGAVGSAFALLYDRIIDLLILFTQKLGYSSRNLSVLLKGTMTSASGRDVIQGYYLDKIKSGPVLGYGIAGGWMTSGRYPHNIILELLVSFGPILGVIACIIVGYLSFSAIKSENDSNRRVGQILFAYCVSLFLSDTFLKCPMFFMLMAIGFQSIPYKFTFGGKYKKRQSKSVLHNS